METSKEFIELVRATTPTKSDYAVAKALGITRSAISSHRIGRSKTLDEDAQINVAKILGLELGYVQACINSERAKRPETKAVYEQLAASFRRSAAALFLSAGLMAGIAAPDTAHAASELAGNNDYTKRRKRKDGEWIRRSTAAFSTPPPQERRAAL